MMLLSPEPDANCFKVGLNDNDVTYPLCPLNVRSNDGSMAGTTRSVDMLVRFTLFDTLF